MKIIDSQVYEVIQHTMVIGEESMAEFDTLEAALSMLDFFVSKHKDKSYRIDQITIKTIYLSDK